MEKSFDRKDRLERFVRDNRPGFDSDQPADDVWTRIEAGLTPDGPSRIKNLSGTSQWKRRILHDWRAAAVVVTVSALAMLTYVNREYGITRDPQMALQLPAYAKEVNQYTQIINEKREELKKLTANKPELYTDFASELDRLENAYTGLRSELPGSPDPEMHLHAMVKNLQWQIDLLNQQLIIIEKIKKANENEESDRDLLSI